MDTLIGGHKGLDVVRKDDGTILKQAQWRDGDALYDPNVKAILNEARFLRIMEDSGITPKLLVEGPDWIVQEDLGDPEPMTDGEAWRRNCLKALHTLRRYGVRHGDLTGPWNVMCFNNSPKIIDWQEAHMIGEPAPQKTKFSDAHLMWRTIAGTKIYETETFDAPRVARRWLGMLGSLGAVFGLELPLKGMTFVDLGCFQGDFPAAAAAEGMIALGVDQGGFRSGEDSIAIGRELWKDLPEVGFLNANLKDYIPTMPRFHVGMMFSTWSYMVQDFGVAPATVLLGDAISKCDVFFFENQLMGDGPGPDFFPNDGAVQAFLRAFGLVEKVITIPVWGRPASRTVFKVTP